MAFSRSTDFRLKRQGYSWEMVLLPELWNRYKADPASIAPEWKSFRIDKANLKNIPKANGVYTLDVCPHVANHLNHAYIFYVGSGNLRARFSKYYAKRPSNEDVKAILEQYEGNVYFSYVVIPDTTFAAKEEALYTAIYPPCNRRGMNIPAILSRTQEKAF